MPPEYAEGLKDTRRPEVGDVLYSVTGSFGIPAIVEGDESFVFQRHIAILKPNTHLATGRFIRLMLEAPEIFEQAKEVATGIAQLTVSLKGLRNFEVPLPSREEQAEIVRRIESAFGWIDRMASEHASATKLLPKLDGAILAKAFQGRLVPQDPDDEPASVLLARIEAQRAELRDRPKKSNSEKSHGTIVETHAGPMRAEVVRPRKPAKVSAMSKSRRDDDVWQQPYLAKLLKSKRTSDPQTLFKFADLPVADFYKQLAWEIDNGHIIDETEKLKAA